MEPSTSSTPHAVRCRAAPACGTAAVGTLLLRAKVDAHRVQRILRHASINTTLGTYGHLDVEDLRDAINALPAGPALPELVPHGAPVVRKFEATGSVGRLLTVREVADHLAVCTATVYALCEQGELRHLRIWNAIRVHPDDPDALIADRRG